MSIIVIMDSRINRTGKWLSRILISANNQKVRPKFISCVLYWKALYSFFHPTYLIIFNWSHENREPSNENDLLKWAIFEHLIHRFASRPSFVGFLHASLHRGHIYRFLFCFFSSFSNDRIYMLNSVESHDWWHFSHQLTTFSNLVWDRFLFHFICITNFYPNLEIFHAIF